MGPLLDIQNLWKTYPVKKGWGKPLSLEAVAGVSLAIAPGEILGLVGESGCGKSTLGRLILKLERATRGKILFQGLDVSDYSERKMRPLRREMQVVFQDPYSSLNPRLSVGTMLNEALSVHKLGNKKERAERIASLLQKVGLRSDDVNRYPHEFSGGGRQRLGIARALSVGPKLVIADEPVSALDVSIQAQILNLLADLKASENLSMFFISHDLRVVEYFTDRVAVMYLGRLVEVFPSKKIKAAQHPYTQALVESVPIPDPSRKRGRLTLPGEVPSPLKPPKGCVFHPRCPKREARCEIEVPTLKSYGPDYQVACHLVEGSIS